jgi:hypothetical protein
VSAVPPNAVAPSARRPARCPRRLAHCRRRRRA